MGMWAIYGAKDVGGTTETLFEEQQLPGEDFSARDMFEELYVSGRYSWLELFLDRELLDSYHAIGRTFTGHYIYKHEIRTGYLAVFIAQGERG